MSALGSEEWRSIEGYEGLYEVSNFGFIKSLSRPVRSKNGSTKTLRTIILKASRGKSGKYYAVILCNDGKKKTKMVHRLVCQTFHGQAPTDGMQVAHRDGDTGNNTSSNLYWATPKQNCEDRERHGTWAHGERVNTNKLSSADVRAIVELSRSGVARKDIAIRYGIHRSSVDQIVRGDTWKHLEQAL